MDKKPDNNKGAPKITIRVKEEWCKKCRICATFCPKGVFETDNFGKPIVKSPEACIKCMLCVIRCPDFCIEIDDDTSQKKYEGGVGYG